MTHQNPAAADDARNDLRAAVAALDAAEVAGEPAHLSQVLAQVARCHRAVGALSEADWYARRGLSVARHLGAVDASVDALCTLAELATERSDRLEQQDESRGRCASDPTRHHRLGRARAPPRGRPPLPPSGPRSMTQSASAITSRSCSITTTLWPPSTRRCSTRISFSTSAMCRPTVGSSSTYSVCGAAGRGA
jgi:hypothetical protein